MNIKTIVLVVIVLVLIVIAFLFITGTTNKPSIGLTKDEEQIIAEDIQEETLTDAEILNTTDTDIGELYEE